MKQARLSLFILFILTALLLSACGGETKKNDSDEKSGNKADTAQNSQGEQGKQEESITEEAQTKKFKDWTDHEVEVPTNPKRVIFHGETTGDLLALGIEPVGVMASSVAGSIQEDILKNAEDVGFPFNVEKAMTLSPDLIIFGNSDAAQYEHISKVAPTVTFNTFAPLDERMRTLGELFGKQAEAEAWLTSYNNKASEMWKKLSEAGIGKGETASVFTMYPGNRLFAMAKTGLSQVVYDENGFAPTAPIQKALDDGQGFVELSTEVLSEFAGDRIFVLTPEPADAAKEMQDLMDTEIWKSLPAVKNGKVYTFNILEVYSDALSRERILNELPKVLNP